MMNRKRVFWVLVLLVVGLLFVQIALAQTQGPPAPQLSFENAISNLEVAVDDLYGLVESPLQFVVGEAETAELFLMKVLFFILIFSLVWVISDRIPVISEKGFVKFLVGFIVSFLSLRGFASSEIVQTVILPYSAFGVALASAIPFVMAFFVIRDFPLQWKKISWMFFAVVFVGLWIVRSDAVGNFGSIYLITAVLGVAMLLLDKTIQKWWRNQEVENLRGIRHDKERRRILREANQLDEDLANQVLNPGQYKYNFDRLRDEAKSYGLKI